MTEQTTTLKRTLGSFRLWGIAVGLVISGGVLRLELRLVAGGHDGVYGRRPGGRRHVLRLYFQLYRADHRHPARWRPLSPTPTAPSGPPAALSLVLPP